MHSEIFIVWILNKIDVIYEYAIQIIIVLHSPISFNDSHDGLMRK